MLILSKTTDVPLRSDQYIALIFARGNQHMRRLWIADVHATLPAFEAVLRDAGKIDEIVFLGDVVGCGPHPAACVDLLADLNAKAVVGNHDTAVVEIGERSDRCSNPVDWNEWTFDQLNDSKLSYLASLPSELSIVSNGVSVQAMHHPAGALYLHPAMPDSVLAAHLKDVPYPVIFCGDSHRQIDRTVDRRRYVCIPPVGQPRDGDTRAGYAIENNGTLTYHYVPYDVEKVIVDLQEIGLADEFYQRWVNFLRTAHDPVWSREYKHEVEQIKLNHGDTKARRRKRREEVRSNLTGRF